MALTTRPHIALGMSTTGRIVRPHAARQSATDGKGWARVTSLAGPTETAENPRNAPISPKQWLPPRRMRVSLLVTNDGW